MVDIAKTCETCNVAERPHLWNDASNPSLGGTCYHGGIERPILSCTTCRFYLTDTDILTIFRLKLGELESAPNSQ